MGLTAMTASAPPAKIHIRKIYLASALLEVPKRPKSTDEWQPHLDVELNASSNRLEEEGSYEVVLQIQVTAKQDGETFFMVRVQQAGLFVIDKVPERDLSTILNAQCPDILFPFGREAVAELVSKGGFPQLLLGPLNFETLYRQKMAALSALQEQKSTSVTH